MSAPDAAMLAAPWALAAYMATLDDVHLEGLFACDAVIVENFAPYLFEDVALWREAFRAHAAELSGLRCTFGAPQDFSRSGGDAYFVLPTTWQGRLRGRAFEEQGGWSFVLEARGEAWVIAAYAWAVTVLRFLEAEG